jgi:hypothetical protein
MTEESGVYRKETSKDQLQISGKGESVRKAMHGGTCL